MQRKSLLAIIPFIVVFAAVISVAVYFVSNQNPPIWGYKKSIVRNTHTAEEENALSVAENLNYTDIFKVNRFMVISSESAYANFIDAEVLNTYDTRYESLKGKIWAVLLNYDANASLWDKIHAVYVPPSENEYAPKVRVLSSNGTILNEYYRGQGRYAYGNSSGIQEVQVNTIDFEFSSCYVVEMSLEYDELIGNLGGFQCYINQTVIVDGNLKPLFVCVESIQAVS